MKYVVGLLWVLVFSCLAFGQSVKLPPEVRGEPGEFIPIKGDTVDKQVKWRSIDRGLNLIPVEMLKDSKTAIVSALKPGRYRLIAWTAKADVPSDLAECVIVIGDAPPVPPGPDPKPPEPKPPEPPTPVPIPEAGFRVLIVTESSDPNTAAAVVTNAQAVRTYLNSHCVKEPGTGWAAWRVWDKDVFTANELPVWQEAFKRAKGKPTPWMIVSDGKAGYEGPLPKTVNETLEILKKIGGP